MHLFQPPRADQTADNACTSQAADGGHLLANDHVTAEQADVADERLRIGGSVAVAHAPRQRLQLAQRAERAGRRGAAAAAVQARAQIRAHRPRRDQALQRGVGKAAAFMHMPTYILHHTAQHSMHALSSAGTSPDAREGR